MGTNENPFAPPSQEAELGQDQNFGDEAQLRVATKSARFVNLLVDSVCHYLIMIPAALMMGALGDTLGPLVMFGAYLLLILYYPLFEYFFFGKTPGKLLTKTRVVRLDGGRPRLMQIIGRSLARWVPFEPFSFFGSSSSGWHDTWSGTRVVQDPR